MNKIIDFRNILFFVVFLTFCCQIHAQGVSFTVQGINPHCVSQNPNGASYSGSATVPGLIFKIKDAVLEVQVFNGVDWKTWENSFTITAPSNSSSPTLNYSSLTTIGAPNLKMTAINSIRMKATIHFTLIAGTTIYTKEVFSPEIQYNYFDSPYVNFNINNEFAYPFPFTTTVYQCQGDAVITDVPIVSGTGIQWRLLEFISSSSGNQGSGFDVNNCGWKDGNPPVKLNITSPELNNEYSGCAIRPWVFIGDEWRIVRLEIKNDCGTSYKEILLHVLTEPALGAEVNFLFRGSIDADALYSGPNNTSPLGEQNPFTNAVSNNDNILSWGGTQTNPTWVGASQTILDCSKSNFAGKLLSWKVDIYIQNQIDNKFDLIGSLTENNVSNSLINIQSVPISINGAPINSMYFTSNFNYSSKGVLGKIFKVVLTGNGICSEAPSKTGFFKIAPNNSSWRINNGEEVENTVEDISILKENLFIFPNPTNEKLTLNINTNYEEIACIRIVNNNGQIIVIDGIQDFPLVKGLNTFSTDINHLPSGTFTLQLIKPSGILTRRFIKL
jgi:hypothetical protein